MSKAKRTTPRGSPRLKPGRGALAVTATDEGFRYPAPERLRAVFGTTSDDFSVTCLAWLMVTREQPGMPPETLAKQVSGGLAAIQALRPRNEAEAMMALHRHRPTPDAAR